jgi:hypothetical protein
MRQIVTVSAVLLLALLSSSIFANAATWKAQGVYDECRMNQDGCRIAVDSHDRPHIAFYQYGPKDELNHWTTEVGYASYNGSGWEKQTLGFGEVLGITTDSNDNPHILYNGYKNGTWQDFGFKDYSDIGYRYPSYMILPIGLMYAKWTGSNWTTVKVGPQYASSAASSASFALDTSGNPHIAYAIDNYHSTNLSNSTIKYAVLTKIGFNTQTICTPETPINLVSLGLGSDDKPQILYDVKSNQPSSDTQDIKYLVLENSSWITQTVFSNVKSHSGIVIDSHNQPHFTLLDGHHLKYASCNDSVWSTQTITDTVEDVVYLCLDSHDKPQIDFIGTIDKEVCLMYGKWTGQNWNFQNISSGRFIGPIVTDSKDNPHIANIVGTGYARSCVYTTSDQSESEPSLSPQPSFPSNEIIIATVILVSLLFLGLIYAVLTLRKH